MPCRSRFAFGSQFSTVRDAVRPGRAVVQVMPDVVLAPSPAQLGEEAVAELEFARPQDAHLGVGSKLAWAPSGKLGHAEWLGVGRGLGAIGRRNQWWIGDWVRYGTSRWGERYASAARITGYDVASLRNMAWVSSRFDLSLRNDKLTWSHHVLLAPLETDERRRWLDRACAEGFSVSQLRLELRAVRTPARGSSDGADAPRSDPVCPHCGRDLRTSIG
jgi:hypothetical protein